jgi:Ca2+/Na+ antiporter
MRQIIRHWLPAAFCAVISIIALFVSVNSRAGWWSPTFFAFLPMCFFFVGSVTYQMQCEIRELRKQLAEMQAKQID